ncbi:MULTISPECIES: DUF1800 family protein [unclassified Nocardioides]|uniref:DUF1800 family protein n=1 Tax=unclassified Nocardioides TaxID=2615069 RepID=UPI0009F102D7|nr:MULTISPECIES: DUF1800 family protein [unclassified Nocardioides]GAW48457.1 uncharacterized protein PD653B2_0771 [Nocardioides sp. PD653-B2]GAW53382.1 uncharacterized protein PD653_0781 [Nocardioides sp. PD653]
MPTSTARASRRTVLGGAAATGTAVTLAGPAGAATSYTPAHYRGDRLLSPAGRHLVGRFSYGVTPELAADVRRAGGPLAWFDAQLDAGAIGDERADELRSWWSGLSRSATEIWRRQRDDIEGGWEVMADYQRWVLLRRIQSKRQVLETVTELWENHFNVPVYNDSAWFWRTQYGDTIRAGALGRFDDLLHAVITHPAMLINLDNVSSSAEHPNENLGRELLELHTVGRGEYDEDDVKSSARILTGWSADMWRTFDPVYRKQWHWTGPVEVIDFTHPNGDADGRAVTQKYLTYLAHHPATARRVARKLAVKFVSDTPSDSLVDQLAQVYLDHDTEIRPVLSALVRSAEFKAAVGAKVRDPGEDVVAAYRALDIRIARPPQGDAGDSHAANQILWQADDIGTKPFDWPRPDGQPIDNDAWASPSRMLSSMSIHINMAGGWWPRTGATYRPVGWWVPRYPIRFDLLVDHLSQVILHRRSTAQLLEACCQAVDVRPHERITRDHGVVKWNWYRLLTTFLDSPAFLTR